MATVKRKTAQDSRPSNPVRAKVTVTSAPASPDDGPALTAALAEIERLKDEARRIREAAVTHETTLERLWRKLSGG